MSADIIRAIDESPLLNLLKECGKAAPGLFARATNAVLDSAGAAIGGAVAVCKGTAAMGSSIFSGPSGPEISPVRTPEISAPAVAQDRFHVCHSELGGFSSPTFGGCGVGGTSLGR